MPKDFYWDLQLKQIFIWAQMLIDGTTASEKCSEAIQVSLGESGSLGQNKQSWNIFVVDSGILELHKTKSETASHFEKIRAATCSKIKKEKSSEFDSEPLFI